LNRLLGFNFSLISGCKISDATVLLGELISLLICTSIAASIYRGCFGCEVCTTAIHFKGVALDLTTKSKLLGSALKLQILGFNLTTLGLLLILLILLIDGERPLMALQLILHNQQ
jgi:hypothetical protein